MSRARNLADLLNSSGDVKADRLDNQTTYSDATGSARGLMSAAMKSKLDAIEAGATADQTKSDITGLGIADDTLSNVASLPANVVTQLRGADGANGPQGATGATGATGAQGPAGADGVSPTITRSGSTLYINS